MKKEDESWNKKLHTHTHTRTETKNKQTKQSGILT